MDHACATGGGYGARDQAAMEEIKVRLNVRPCHHPFFFVGGFFVAARCSA
jgi:hypothetical protein